jgi:hypothetical protein
MKQLAGVAGVTSKRQNLELGRYHENETIQSTRRDRYDPTDNNLDSKPIYEYSRLPIEIKKPELVPESMV